MNRLRFFYTSGFAWIWLTVVVVALDRYSKMWVLDHLRYQVPLKILPFLNFTLSFNTGAAFSFLNNASGWQNIFLCSIAIIISIGMIYWLIRLSAQAYWMSMALCFILGGALGNVWDRVLYGYVIDFLSFHLGDWYFAIFNLADSAICVGAFMIFLHWAWFDKSKERPTNDLL